MDTRRVAALGVLALLLISGCRTRVASHIVEVPRVDMALGGGNRGYLIGTAPESTREIKPTRQIVQTDIELPSLYNAKPSGTPVTLDTGSPDQTAAPQPEVEPSAGAPGRYDTYVVQKGESLWSIAAKPEVYGKATRWQRLFDANRELLKGDPNRLRAGMKIRIPRSDAHGSGAADADEGVKFKK